MASNKIIHFGPGYISNSATNIITPPTLTGGTGLSGTNTNTYLIIRRIEIVNTTASAVSFSLYLGATGASLGGTEVVGTGLSVPANTTFTWFGLLRIDVTQFLTGLASTGSALTFHAEGEIGIA